MRSCATTRLPRPEEGRGRRAQVAALVVFDSFPLCHCGIHEVQKRLISSLSGMMGHADFTMEEDLRAGAGMQPRLGFQAILKS